MDVAEEPLDGGTKDAGDLVVDKDFSLGRDTFIVGEGWRVEA